MNTDLSITTWAGIASCVLGCGCWLGATVQGSQAKQIGSARAVQLSDLKELLPLLPLLVAVRGKAWTDTPIQCETEPQLKAVFSEIKEHEHTTRKDQTGNWQRHQTPVRHSVKHTEWYVKDNGKVEVRDATKADSMYLAEIGHVWTDAQGSVLGKAVDIVTGLQVLGRDKVEKALPVGTSVTVVGELVSAHPAAPSKLRSPHMALQKPRNGGPLIISNRTFDDIVIDYKDSSEFFKKGCIFFGGIGVALLGFKAVSFGWKKWREKQIRDRVRRVEERRAAARLATGERGSDQAGADEPDAAAEAGHTCVICLEHACDTVFQSCGHMCTCSQCSRNLNRCPICRTKTRAIRVYRP